MTSIPFLDVLYELLAEGRVALLKVNPTQDALVPVFERAFASLRPGGRWHYRWHKADGSQMEMTGEFREVSPVDRLVNTERWGGDWAETVNEHVLTEVDGGTLLTSTMQFPRRR